MPRARFAKPAGLRCLEAAQSLLLPPSLPSLPAPRSPLPALCSPPPAAQASARPCARDLLVIVGETAGVAGGSRDSPSWPPGPGGFDTRIPLLPRRATRTVFGRRRATHHPPNHDAPVLEGRDPATRALICPSRLSHPSPGSWAPARPTPRAVCVCVCRGNRRAACVVRHQPQPLIARGCGRSISGS